MNIVTSYYAVPMHAPQIVVSRMEMRFALALPLTWLRSGESRVRTKLLSTNGYLLDARLNSDLTLFVVLTVPSL
jgi:hypothetical protein